MGQILLGKKVIYDTILAGINSGDTVAAIANNAGVTRKTIYAIKNRLSITKKKTTSKSSLFFVRFPPKIALYGV